MTFIEVILITGESRSGKTTFANQIAKECTNGYSIIAFADPLKEFTADLLNSTYAPETKFTAKEMDDFEYKAKIHDGLTFAGKPLTVRNALIHIGMGMRKHDPDVWVNALFVKMKQILFDNEWQLPYTFIIHDLRFINEAERFITTEYIDFIPLKVSTYYTTRDESIKQENENEIKQIITLMGALHAPITPQQG